LGTFRGRKYSLKRKMTLKNNDDRIQAVLETFQSAFKLPNTKR